MPRHRSRPAVAALLGVPLLCASLTSCTAGPTPSATPSAPAATATPSPAESLLTDAIDEATAVGELAEDFPADLVPVPPDAQVLVSSAEHLDDGLLRISLNVRTPQDTAGLLDAVRGPLLSAGFTESTPPAPEAGLAAQATFSRSEGAELLVVGVLDRDGLRTMTLGGTVAAPSP